MSEGPVLVTGGTGFAGSHLVRALVADGIRVRVLTRSQDRALAILPSQTEIFEGDVTDRAAVRRALEGTRLVFHLATSFQEPGIPDSRYHEVHVEGTRHLLESVAETGIERFVHCSTVGVHGHIPDPPADEEYRFAPGDIYQVTKLKGEQEALEFCRREGVPVAVARPAPIYGPGDLRLLKLFSLIARGRFLTLGDGKIFYHMVYVEDLIRGFRLLAEHPNAVGEIFILGGPDYCTLNDLTLMIAGTLGVPPPRFHFPAWPVQLLGSACEAICKPMGATPPIYRRRVDFFTKSRAFSIEKARRELGYDPEVSTSEGVDRTATWYRENGYLPPLDR